MNSGSGHPKGTSPYPGERMCWDSPRRTGGVSLPSRLQAQLPVLFFCAGLRHLVSPSPAGRGSVLCPPACLPPCSPGPESRTRSHSQPCHAWGVRKAAFGCAAMRWEGPTALPRGSEPLPGTELSPHGQFRGCSAGWVGHCWLCLAPGWLQWGRCFPTLSDWSSPWVGNSGKAFAELQVILPFIL